MSSSKPGNYFYAFTVLALTLGLSVTLALRAADSETPSIPFAALPDGDPERAASAVLPFHNGGSKVNGDGKAELMVQVKSITISGNQALSTSELQQLVASMVGSEHSVDQLNAAARRITAYYRERGFTAARAYLAQQDIADGTTSILVAEGRTAGHAFGGRGEAATVYTGRTQEEPRPGDRGLLLLYLLRSQR